MRTRNYQQDLGTQFGELTDTPSPKDSPIYIGPPILGVNKREKRSEIKINESPNCKNARVLRNYIEPRPRFTLISSSFDASIVYIREFSVSTGENYLIIITTKSLYYSVNLSTFTRIPWPYTDGTVTIAAGTSTIVTGYGTLWSTNARVGDRFKVGSGAYVTILTVDSNTQLTLTSSYTSYGIVVEDCEDDWDEKVAGVHIISDTDNIIRSADASDQATLNTLLNEIKTDYNLHIPDTDYHTIADSTNPVTAADATNEATSVTLSNEIKVKFNAHLTQSNVHPANDILNSVTTADSTNLASAITLGNEIKADFNLHTTQLVVDSTKDTGDKQVGTGSSKFIVSVPVTAGTILATETISPAINLTTATHISLWIKSSVATAAGDLHLLLDNTAYCASPLETLSIPALVANTWTRVNLTLSTPASLTAIVSIGLKYTVDIGACSIWLDDIRSTNSYTVDRYFGGDEDNLFWGVTLADIDYFAFSQGIDPVMFISTALTSISRLSSDCPAANFGIQYADRLIIGDIPNYPFRLMWTIAGTYTNWTGTGSGYKDWVEDPYGITGFSIMGGILIVYKTYSIGHITRTGRADDPFNFEVKVPGIGCFIGGSLVSLGDADIFVGSDNIYTYDLRSAEPVGDNIKDFLLMDLNPAYTHTGHALVIEEYSEVQFYYAGIDNTSPNKAIIYNYDMDIWSGIWEFSSAVHSSGYATQVVSGTWDSDDETWDSDSTEWDSNLILSSQPLNLIAQGTSLYKQEPTSPISGANLDFVWETKDFVPEEELKSITAYRVIVSYYALTSGNLIFDTSVDGGQSWQNYQIQALETTTPSRVRYMFFDLLTTDEVICGRFRSIDGGRFQIVKVRLEAISAGDVNG